MHQIFSTFSIIISPAQPAIGSERAWSIRRIMDSAVQLSDNNHDYLRSISEAFRAVQ